MERPICQNEGCTHLAKPSKKYKIGFAPLCSSCEQKKYGIWDRRKTKDYHTRNRYATKEQRLRIKLMSEFENLVCEECGFVPVDYCQLDIHHVDEDHFNNDRSNLQLLCACCHRLKHSSLPSQVHKLLSMKEEIKV